MAVAVVLFIVCAPGGTAALPRRDELQHPSEQPSTTTFHLRSSDSLSSLEQQQQDGGLPNYPSRWQVHPHLSRTITDRHRDHPDHPLDWNVRLFEAIYENRLTDLHEAL
jgi:hypothetical protein